MVAWPEQRKDSRGEFKEGGIWGILSTAELPQKISSDTVISVQKWPNMAARQSAELTLDVIP